MTDVRYGFEHGLLGMSAVSDYAQSRVEDGDVRPEMIELLWPDSEAEEAREALGKLAPYMGKDEDRLEQKRWEYVLVCRAIRDTSSSRELSRSLDDLYTYFGYPNALVSMSRDAVYYDDMEDKSYIVSDAYIGEASLAEADRYLEEAIEEYLETTKHAISA